MRRSLTLLTTLALFTVVARSEAQDQRDPAAPQTAKTATSEAEASALLLRQVAASQQQVLAGLSTQPAATDSSPLVVRELQNILAVQLLILRKLDERPAVGSPGYAAAYPPESGAPSLPGAPTLATAALESLAKETLPDFRGHAVIEPQTGVPVLAQYQYIERRVGRAKIVELIHHEGKPIPVAVTYPAMPRPDPEGAPFRLEITPRPQTASSPAQPRLQLEIRSPRQTAYPGPSYR